MRMWQLWNFLADGAYFVGVALGLLVFAGLIYLLLPLFVVVVLACLIAIGVGLGIHEIRHRSADTDPNG